MEIHDRPVEILQKRASVCAGQIGEKGDVLMYGSKRVGAAADVFNRLAEGIACLLLITRHPVPFETLVFYPDGNVVEYESEKEANAQVWPVQEKTKESTSQLEVVQGVREGANQASSDIDDTSSNKKSEKDDGQDAAC